MCCRNCHLVLMLVYAKEILSEFAVVELSVSFINKEAKMVSKVIIRSP